MIDLIRGKSVDEALHILHFAPKHASNVAEKVLRSAVSNLQNKDGAGRLEADQMYVKTVFVDVGMTMKRISPAPMGRAFRIRKRSHHLTIVVAAKEEPVRAAKTKPAKQQEPKSAKEAKKTEPATGAAKTPVKKKKSSAAETK
jgi:large subunit ribosomal protein L22